MEKQNQFKLIWFIPVVIIAATVVTVVIFGLGSKGVSGTPGYKVELDFNSPPTASCNEDEVWNYCVDSRNPELSWNYSDPEGDPQESYWLQIDDNSDFSSPKIDTDEVYSSGSTYRPPDEILAWNTTYFWRIKVKDNQGRWSDWCLPSCSFPVPKHAYPNVTGPYEFKWSPPEPSALEPVQFTDKTKFYNGGNKWFWTFEGADPLISTLQNPVATFSAPGEWEVTLEAEDSDGYKCKTEPPIKVNVAKPLPEWEEVKPR